MEEETAATQSLQITTNKKRLLESYIILKVERVDNISGCFVSLYERVFNTFWHLFWHFLILEYILTPNTFLMYYEYDASYSHFDPIVSYGDLTFTGVKLF